MFEWQPSLTVHSPEMDAQHQRLFQLVDRLYNSMLEGRGKQIMEAVLNELVNYTRSHFRDEEALMQEHAFPGLAAHRLQHTALTRQVLDFQNSVRMGQATVTVQVLQFLRDWLNNHIRNTDAEYGRYLTTTCAPKTAVHV